MIENDNKIVYATLTDTKWFSIFKLKMFMLFHRNSVIALDMKAVKSIQENFLDFLKYSSNHKKISLFNLNSDIMMLLGVRYFSRYVDIYTDRHDFMQDVRALVNRRFSVV